MKRPKDQESSFFVDESGDATFYDCKGRCIVGQTGCSEILILGFIETQVPAELRRAVLELHREVISDPYLQKIPSHHKTAIAFHAHDDAPEIKYLFFRLIRQLDFKAQFIVARKQEEIFRKVHRGKENKFYDDLVTHLFQNVLHRFRHNRIFFAARGSAARQKPLARAIWRAKGRFDLRHNTGLDHTQFALEAQSPKGEPCLSVIDYMNWAVYRAFTRREMRYYGFVADKVSFLRDLYGPNESKNCYCRKRPFEVNKAAPLGLGSSSERTA